jgi:hypothetical protein
MYVVIALSGLVKRQPQFFQRFAVQKPKSNAFPKPKPQKNGATSPPFVSSGRTGPRSQCRPVERVGHHSLTNPMPPG